MSLAGSDIGRCDEVTKQTTQVLISSQSVSHHIIFRKASSCLLPFAPEANHRKDETDRSVHKYWTLRARTKLRLVVLTFSGWVSV